MIWVVPLPSPAQDSSHHQDYSIFSRGSQPKPSFVTVTGRGDNPINDDHLGRCMWQTWILPITPFERLLRSSGQRLRNPSLLSKQSKASEDALHSMAKVGRVYLNEGWPKPCHASPGDRRDRDQGNQGCPTVATSGINCVQGFLRPPH